MSSVILLLLLINFFLTFHPSYIINYYPAQTHKTAESVLRHSPSTAFLCFENELLSNTDTTLPPSSSVLRRSQPEDNGRTLLTASSSEQTSLLCYLINIDSNYLHPQYCKIEATLNLPFLSTIQHSYMNVHSYKNGDLIDTYDQLRANIVF